MRKSATIWAFSILIIGSLLSFCFFAESVGAGVFLSTITLAAFSLFAFGTKWSDPTKFRLHKADILQRNDHYATKYFVETHYEIHYYFLWYRYKLEERWSGVNHWDECKFDYENQAMEYIINWLKTIKAAQQPKIKNDSIIKEIVVADIIDSIKIEDAK